MSQLPRRVSIVASSPVGGLPPAQGPTSGERPYDPRRVRTPGTAPVRHAHRVAPGLPVYLPARHARHVAARARLGRVEPAWIVGAILVAALLQAGIVAGSSDGSSGTAGPRIERHLVIASEALLLEPTVLSGVADRTIVPPPGLFTGRSTAAVSPPHPRPSVSIGRAATPRRRGTPGATATPRPPPTRVVKHTVRRATAAPTRPRPRTAPRPTSSPTPAIVYRHRATGRASWGHFGGRVITRLPEGTRIRVCGSRGCWAGVSAGYGPTESGGMLVDVDAAVFRRICGSLAIGVGTIVLSWR